MTKCAFENCHNNTKKHTKKNHNITFHKFPRDPKYIKEWARVINRPDWEPNKNSRVCSLHFPESCLYETQCGQRKVVQDAVPSVAPQQLPTVKKEPEPDESSNEKSVKKEPESDESSNKEIVKKEPDSSNEESVGAVNASYMSEAEITQKLKNHIVWLKELSKRRRVRITALYTNRRCLRKRLKVLIRMIENFQEKCCCHKTEAVNIS
ncbi:uncharacterized protein [Epargyreus clarus]|uniref:uncharacterized protein n=1 Tax=Epargyreus clarus TaxID=520877 RepID=UPI003C30E89E